MWFSPEKPIWQTLQYPLGDPDLFWYSPGCQEQVSHKRYSSWLISESWCNWTFRGLGSEKSAPEEWGLVDIGGSPSSHFEHCNKLSDEHTVKQVWTTTSLLLIFLWKCMCCKEVSSSVVSDQVSGPRRLSLMQSKSVQVEGRPAVKWAPIAEGDWCDTTDSGVARVEALGDFCDIQLDLGACWDDAHRIPLFWMAEIVFQFR